MKRYVKIDDWEEGILVDICVERCMLCLEHFVNME